MSGGTFMWLKIIPTTRALVNMFRISVNIGKNAGMLLHALLTRNTKNHSHTPGITGLTEKNEGL